jgi:hypothetical protein
MSLPSFEEAQATAREVSPFSNGTEGECWMENNCHRCINDAPTRRDEWDKGCPLIMVALLGKTPVEWMETNPYGLGNRYMCIYFRDENDGPGPEEPTPIPDPPGQDALFPRDDFERPARMYVDTKPQEVSIHG